MSIFIKYSEKKGSRNPAGGIPFTALCRTYRATGQGTVLPALHPRAGHWSGVRRPSRRTFTRAAVRYS